MRHQGRRWHRLGGPLLVLIAALAIVGSAAAAPQLTGQRTSSNFYPCTDPPGPPNPTLADCVGALPLDVQVTGSCNPAGNSTLTLTRSGNAFGAPPLFNGTYSETITWTIGPQADPAVPAFFPFSGAPPAESVGLSTGEVLELTSSFTITEGATTITGTKSLVPNAGNWGVCRQPVDEVLGGPVFGGAPLTGEIYILGAGVLSYDVTSGIAPESGLAETYMMNSYLTCCSAASPSSVASAAGHLESGFGSSHPATGTSGSELTPEGTSTVEPLPEVEVTGTVPVGGSGETTVVQTTSVPPLPAGFSVGDPPAFYNITTEADYTFPITVCIGFGALPAGATQPTLFHYQNGLWEDVTTSFTFDPNKVCGEVDSLSPFAVAFETGPDYTLAGPFEPVNTGIVNTAKAGQTIPVKFSLGGDFGLDVFAEGYPLSVGAPCEGGPTDSIETTSNGAGLTYDAATGVYTYHWQTAKSWAGHCRMLTVLFADGSGFQADFKFK